LPTTLTRSEYGLIEHIINLFDGEIVGSMKRKKKPRNKLLQEECGDLWKEIIELRDGRRCMVEVLFPEIAVNHDKVYQADHCFTRANKFLFFEVSNGTMVCSGCNMNKHYDNKSVKRAIDMIVMDREGEERYKEMLACDMKKSANSDWNKVRWLEEQRDRLLLIRDKLGKEKK